MFNWRHFINIRLNFGTLFAAFFFHFIFFLNILALILPVFLGTIQSKVDTPTINNGIWKERKQENWVRNTSNMSKTTTTTTTNKQTLKHIRNCWFFSKNLNQRSLTPRWPLTPCLLRSHVWLYSRIIVSKFHDNTSMYVDTVINFAKYHIHTHTYIHIYTTYYVQNEWSHSLLLNSVQARQELGKLIGSGD